MKKNILIYNSGGGLGDSIQLFPLILSLKNYFIKTKIYYLSAHSNHFNHSLKEYGIKIDTLDLNLEYFGFRWWHYFFVKKRFNKLKLEKFDLIIDLQSKIRNTLILKQLPSNEFYSSTYNFYFSSIKKKFITSNNISDTTIQNLNIFLQTNIDRINYSLDKLPSIYLKEAKRLLPNNSYIGFSITQGNAYRKKSWDIDKFIELANKIKLKHKVPVFFVEKNNFDLIELIKSRVDNALFPEQKSKLSCPALVTALANRLDKAVSIDNGIMHMIGLTNIPMIVLFGPTNANKFSPKNENITIIDSKEIYKSDDINKIQVVDVYKNI